MARFFIEKLFFSFSKVIYKLLKITSKWKVSCFQWFKDTNLKANHNEQTILFSSKLAVSNGSKILIWKQITTPERPLYLFLCCFQWFKDTNLKANHNLLLCMSTFMPAVSNGSKILIWKQITTAGRRGPYQTMLFPMVQRY